MNKQVNDVVKQVLEQHPIARDDNNYLYCYVYNQYGYHWNGTFISVLKGIKDGKLPTFESVVRARRKIQENEPRLRASAQTQAIRENEKQQYINYSRGIQ